MSFVYCDYHDNSIEAPLCEHGKPKRLLGFDNGPDGWGHIWAVCECVPRPEEVPPSWMRRSARNAREGRIR